MRYLKIFENYQTEEEVSKICEKYGITNWSINKDGLVDVGGNVNLRSKELTKLPVKFGIVPGYFSCSDNQLTTLEGAPQSVGEYFYCTYNKLTTLEGAPQLVDGSFYCSHNKLTNLEGAPQSVGGNFWCNHNELTTLEGAPYSVSGHFDCSHNKLTTLKGAPESVDGSLWCHENYLTTLEGSPRSVSDDFYCQYNLITTLKGAPYSVGGSFWPYDNPLPDLIEKNMEYKYHILAYQEIYQIYNSDGSINEKQFYLMMFSSYLKKSESQTKINDIVDILNDINRLTKSYKGNLSKKEILDILLKSLISYDGKDKPKIISKLAESNPKNFERLKQVMDEIGEDTFKADLNKDMGDLGF